MSEDNITVNADEVAKVEQEIEQKEAAQNANTEKAVEQKVRAEMQKEQELKSLREELVAKEKAVQELQKAQEATKSEADKLIQAEVARRVEQEVATTKAHRTAQNPLNVQEPSKQFSVGEGDVERIEQASRDAFFEKNKFSLGK